MSLLVEHSYRHADSEIFDLASGRKSDTYIDCKLTTMRSEAAQSIATLFEEHVPAGAQAVGGLTAGADPIAYAMRDLCHKIKLDAFMVRKEAKAHGLKKFIEGPVSKGTRVVVVDDVVTSGGSTIKAIERCRAEGMEVVAVIVLVDREEGGLPEIKKIAGPSIPVEPIFRKSELFERWRAANADANARTGRSAATAR